MAPLYPAVVTVLALMNCGRNRTKHKIAAPAITGHEEYERAYRVQMNALKHMVFFLTSMLAVRLVVSANRAAGIGLLLVVGRILFTLGYYRDPTKRVPGMVITLAAQIVLFIGSFVCIGGMLTA